MTLPLMPILALSFVMGGVGYVSAHIEPSTKGRKAIDEIFEASSFYTKVTEGTLRPQFIKKQRLEWGERYFYNLPKGLSSEQAKSLSIRLTEGLKRDVDITFDYYTLIDVYNHKMRKKIDFDESLLNPNDYKVPLGLNHKHEVIELDFTGPFSHLLIGGISGAGKSQLVHLILTALSLKEKKPNLYLCDLKFGVELQDFEGMEHVKGFVTNLSDLDMMLSLVIEDMTYRYKIMKKNNQRFWKGYPIVFLLDEMIDIKINSSDSDNIKWTKGRIKEKIADLTAKGRAARVYCVLATQRPDKDVINGIIKTNVASTVGFKTRDDIQSRIILDNSKSAELEYIPGRAYLQQSEDVLIQTFYLSEEKERELLQDIPKVKVVRGLLGI